MLSSLLVLTFALPVARAAQEPVPRLLYPAADTVVLAKEVQLIVLAAAEAPSPSVSLNGQAVKLDKIEFAPGWIAKSSAAAARVTGRTSGPSNPVVNKVGKVLFVATASLQPGQNVIQTGHQATRLFYATASNGRGGPSGWPIFHPHPGVPDTNQPIACLNCHETQRGQPTMDRPKLPGACQVCHTPVDLRLIHSHVMDPLANCFLCHDPHGAVRPSLLRQDKEHLCTQCHEGGHAKD